MRRDMEFTARCINHSITGYLHIGYPPVGRGARPSPATSQPGWPIGVVIGAVEVAEDRMRDPALGAHVNWQPFANRLRFIQ
jgi:hypothetical protein